jgi:adenylate kinase
MNIFIMGAPGSGKGTFSSRIKDEFNLNHVSTGDIFRSNMQNNTPLGQEAKSYIEKGLLVPDELTNKMVEDYLQNLPDKKNGYLLDGYPRTAAQAEAFDAWTKGTDSAVDLVLSMEVPYEVLTKRITGRRSCPKCHEIFNIYYKAPEKEGICDVCGAELTSRADDNEESLKVRLGEYDSSTAPVIEHYKEEGKAVSVDADRPIEEIWTDIREILAR